MSVANPWSPDWRPDPTGRRAMMIRASRRGSLLAALLLWPLALLATLTSPGRRDEQLLSAILLAGLTWPGLALLGAGLAPATLGSRIDAAVAGLALGIGAPVAAVTSTLIGLIIVVSFTSPGGRVGEAAGAMIRLGVQGATRWAPLVALAAIVWVLLVRRLATRGDPVRRTVVEEPERSTASMEEPNRAE